MAVLEAATGLDLFNYSPQRWQEVSAVKVGFDHLKAGVIRSTKAFENYWNASGDRVLRLDRHFHTLKKQYRDLDSSQTASEAYLKMVDDLTPLGATQEEIVDLHRVCVDAQIKLTTQDVVWQKTHGGQRMGVSAPTRLIANLMKGIVTDTADSRPIPSWIKGGREGWVTFFQRYIATAEILGEGDSPANQRGIEPGLGGVRYKIYPDALPDWMEEYKGEVPPREVVQSEIDQDNLDREAVLAFDDILPRQAELFTTSANEKLEKTKEWASKKLEEAASVGGTFPTTLYLLDALPALYRPFTYETVIEEQDGARVNRLATGNIDKYLDGQIGVYASWEGTRFDKENIALWIEKKLKQAGLIQSASDLATKDLVKILGLAILPRPDVVQADGKAKRILNNDIRPLMQGVQDGDRVFLQQYLAEGKDAQELIWAIAEVLSDSKNNLLSLLDSASNRAVVASIDELKRHTYGWMRSNWRWTLEELLSRMPQPLEQLPEAPDKEVLIEPETAATEYVWEGVTQLEKETVELEEEELGGWRTLYVLNPRQPDERHMVEISGRTIQEREDELASYLGKNKVSCTIPSSSIVEVLKEIVTTPPEVENIRMKIQVNGNTYRKRKRAGMRILYQVDPNQKLIRFHLYKKEDMSYRKL